MKAILLHNPGASENMVYADVPVPSIKPDEVLVKTVSLSINPVDYKSRANENTLSWLFAKNRPVILGWDISGIAEAVGSEVKNIKPGDAVFGMVNFPGAGNAYAGYVAAPASHLALKPANISHEEASAATLAALTALQVLNSNGGIKKGDKVLIQAASGGVGHYAVQIAKYFGAYVTGTSSAANRDFVLSLGADEHVDYRSPEFENMNSEADFVLDSLGGTNISRSIDLAKPGGKVVTIPSGNIPEADLQKAKEKNVNLSFTLVQSSGTDMNTLAQLLGEGKIRSVISKTFSFDQMREAHDLQATGRVTGKLAVRI